MIVVASKIDACQDASRIETVRLKGENLGLEFFAISSVTGVGLEELRYAISGHLFEAQEKGTIAIGS